MGPKQWMVGYYFPIGEAYFQRLPSMFVSGRVLYLQYNIFQQITRLHLERQPRLEDFSLEAETGPSGPALKRWFTQHDSG